jgi:glycosyltransferase involved in cell wall biosynthesis
VMFDPTDVEAIAQALEQVWSDEQVRRTLVDAGRRRVAELSWARTASAFCLHYHALAAEDGLRRPQRHA